jgi:hypothetical protein
MDGLLLMCDISEKCRGFTQAYERSSMDCLLVMWNSSRNVEV